MLMQIVDLFLHLDVHLNQLVADLGPWTYVVLFGVLFCETGLVVTPVLPGDSLLFAVGALAATEGSTLDIGLVAFLLFLAAVLGDACNFFIGRKVGPAVFNRDSRFLSRKNLEMTRGFYERHGGKTIVLARFVPIVRTFAPFVAGIGDMSYKRFASYNVVGAALWVLPLLGLGYFLGNIPAVKTNFHYVVVGIVIVSVLPALVKIVQSRQAAPL